MLIKGGPDSVKILNIYTIRALKSRVVFSNISNDII